MLKSQYNTVRVTNKKEVTNQINQFDVTPFAIRIVPSQSFKLQITKWFIIISSSSH